MEKQETGTDKFRILSRQETLQKQWGKKYFGNPYDKELQDFTTEFERTNHLSEEVNGMQLNFISEDFRSGGGYLFGVNMHAGEKSQDEDIFISNDAQYAYPFFEAIKKFAETESDASKVLEVAKIMASAVPAGIKKKTLETKDLMEIHRAKESLGKHSLEME